MQVFASIMDPLQTFRGHISDFLTDSLLRGEVVKPQPGGPGPIFITPGTGWPSYTPRHWVPILVTFYDMHGLDWDYSLILATTAIMYIYLWKLSVNKLVVPTEDEEEE